MTVGGTGIFLENMHPQLRIAYDNRLLRSAREVDAFDAALAAYAGHPNVDDLKDLIAIFDDQTENPGMMFGLVHLIEDFPAEPSFRVLVKLLPSFQESAAGWLATIILRILNDGQSRAAFTDLLQTASPEELSVAMPVIQKTAI